MKKTIKKALIFIITTLIVCTFSCVYSANGDAVGKIYSTDIKASINGVWVDSYNIGGKTVVIVEDITTQFSYWDALRTLVIDDFAPDYLVASTKTQSQKPGRVIGNIYKTDIKTYFRGRELTSYSLNGKMAVSLEELAADNTFSSTGGKFIWNSVDRTITLEIMYRYPYSMRNMLEDKGYNIVLKEDNGALVATPHSAPLMGGDILCEKQIPDNTFIKVLYNGEIIGYRCRFAELLIEPENGAYSCSEIQTPVDYFYTDKVEKMIIDAGEVTPTLDDWMNYFNYRTVSTVIDSFETDEYMFLLMFFANSHGGTDGLIKINKKDGTRIDYDNRFKSVSYSGNKDFIDVKIDRENEKVYLHYDVDYEIDLKTDAIKPLQNSAEPLLIDDVAK